MIRCFKVNGESFRAVLKRTEDGWWLVRCVEHYGGGVSFYHWERGRTVQSAMRNLVRAMKLCRSSATEYCSLSENFQRGLSA